MIEQIVSPEYLARHHYNQGGERNPYEPGSEDCLRYQAQINKMQANEDQEDLWAFR